MVTTCQICTQGPKTKLLQSSRWDRSAVDVLHLPAGSISAYNTFSPMNSQSSSFYRDGGAGILFMVNFYKQFGDIAIDTELGSSTTDGSQCQRPPQPYDPSSRTIPDDERLTNDAVYYSLWPGLRRGRDAAWHEEEQCKQCWNQIAPFNTQSPLDIMAFCYKVPDLRNQWYQPFNNGVCEDGVGHGASRMEKVGYQPLCSSDAYIEFDGRTVSSRTVLQHGDDCSDCGSRCKTTNECRLANLQDLAKKGCFHASTQFRRRASSSSPIENVTASSLIPGDYLGVWDISSGRETFSRMLGFFVAPRAASPGTDCTAGNQGLYVEITYGDEKLTVMETHYVEVMCGTVFPSRAAVAGACAAVLARDLSVGQALPVWDDAAGEQTSALISGLRRFDESHVAYMPVTASGLAFVLAGGAIVPMDSVTFLLDNMTVPRDQVLVAARLFQGAHKFMEATFPPSWLSAAENAFFAPAESIVYGPCVETVAGSNAIAVLVNNSATAKQLVAATQADVGTLVEVGAFIAGAFCEICSDCCARPGHPGAMSVTPQHGGAFVTITASGVANASISDVSVFLMSFAQMRAPSALEMNRTSALGSLPMVDTPNATPSMVDTPNATSSASSPAPPVFVLVLLVLAVLLMVAVAICIVWRRRSATVMELCTPNEAPTVMELNTPNEAHTPSVAAQPRRSRIGE
jgi:hypothetical protein